jgi:hypothetical protein
MRGMNDDEIVPLTDFALANDLESSAYKIGCPAVWPGLVYHHSRWLF